MRQAIIIRRREVTMEQAVEEVTRPDADGVVEALRDQIEKQNRLIARMLNVQFEQYQEDFAGPEDYPKSAADRLAYILGVTVVEA